MKWNFQMRSMGKEREKNRKKERVSKSAAAPPDLGKLKSRKFRALSCIELLPKYGKSPAKMNKQILLCDDLEPNRRSIYLKQTWDI